MKNMVCIICPRGCNLSINDNNEVSGNFCPRGKIYALQEISNPLRTLTTTISINSIRKNVISVKSNKPLPKARLFEAMEIINKTSALVPIKIGDVLIKNILDLDIDIIATENLEK